ncbi:anti-sigma B factor antagonist [Paenibacillus anaericanus]|uniref:STAS domain-containing protein n=1 Tax=Paenibacillus anaericanus TaxID=170367 RepID=UPI00278B0990|nr:STAS domain-containing protein [Paenibacillus anaericanus]MDQ0087857.1 anti-sigma B factor antagonist [Paenibacillus anaericanus]
MSELIIKVPETFTVDKAVQFRDTIRDYINSGKVNFLLDFSECQFIDSTGLGVIVSSYKKCVESGGDIKLSSLNPSVRKIFELTRLNNVFEIL